jgi:hypothetical protein
MHPDIHLTLHHTRAAELRAEAGVRPAARDRHALRTRLGWTLVEVGLRLATRPGTAAAVH